MCSRFFITDMESELLAKLLEQATDRKVSRNEFICQFGAIDKNIYFVEKGAIRVFLQNEHEEQTIRFGYQGSFITALSSFLQGVPSVYYIQAIRATDLKVISKEHFETLIAADPRYLLLYNKILEELVIQQLEREIDLLTVSPTERLQRVLKRSPQLFMEIPSRYIASYLRMTPETLSRARKLLL